jgi:hypothetical protein
MLSIWLLVVVVRDIQHSEQTGLVVGVVQVDFEPEHCRLH